MRVIDIDPIVEKLKNAIYLGKRIYADTSDLEAILADIEAQPTADKKGKWIPIKNTRLVECECGFITDRLCEYNFCPNCGARMEESDG